MTPDMFFDQWVAQSEPGELLSEYEDRCFQRAPNSTDVRESFFRMFFGKGGTETVPPPPPPPPAPPQGRYVHLM